MEFFLTSVVILSAVVSYGTACPTECTCTYDSNGVYVDCWNKKLGYIPTNLPHTTYELQLQANKIKTIEENSFVNLTNLYELRLEYNEISVIKENAFVNLPGLRYLCLHNNNITVFDPQMTRSMPNLYYINLYNNNITVLDPQMTRSMPNLYELQLQGNKIKTIEENSFVNLSYLSELVLVNNEISVIKENAFVNLPGLHRLQLQVNKIKTIEENSFVNLTNLYFMYLGNNEISVIKENAFVNLPGLQRLYLNNNNITVLDLQMTRRMPNLQELDLEANKIKTIEENSFVNMTNLSLLSLRNNVISVIEENAFVNLPGLQRLYLNNNNITVLDPQMTKSMPNLFELHLEANKMKTIEKNSFVNQNNLSQLYFDNNEISVIKENAFVNLPGLWYLSLRSNPLTCNCSILPFWTWLTRRPSLRASAICSNGTNVIDITSSALHKCNDTINGQWSNWGSWTACSLTCGNGTQYRNHYCNSPTPANGGSVCQGFSNESVVCNNGACPETSDISSVTKSLQSLTTIDNYTVHDIVGLIKNLTYDPTILTSIDIITVADVLVNVSKVPSIDEKVLDGIFDIIDSVINVNISTLRNGQDKGSATNRLLEVVNAVSTSLDIGQKTGARFLRDNILMDVYDVSDMKSPVIGIQIDTGEFEALSNSTVKTITPEKEVKVNTSDAAIILPVELIRGTNKSTRVVLNVYRNWNLFAVWSDIKQYDPNSRIVAASIIQDGRPVHYLGQYKVKALFYPRIERGNIICGYWDYDLHEKSGGWATDGCVLNGKEYGRYVCICDHLTNFAVLVNIGGQDTLVDSLALKTISYIGLILSIIGLSLTVLSFILLKHLRKGRGQQTLVNLAFSLLCFLIVFISGIEQTQDFYSCIAIALLLHYFILVAFMWMLIEGILQYLRFVKVLGTYIPRFILKTAAPAWGVPLIPVIIVLTLDHKLYHGGNKACWMSLSAFYCSFAVPVCVIVLANIIIFIMILKNLVGRPKGLTSNQSKKNRATMNLRAALSVLVLLGLTWIFGFFTIEGASVVFQYIFTILNVFQGFLIFVLFTAGDKQVRQGWKQLCCRQKPREIYLKAGTSSNENKNNIRTDNRNNNTELTEIDFSMDN